jgi:hypothetical protein
MKIKKIESFYIVNNIKDHKKIKNKFLNYLDKMPNLSENNPDDKIFKTDWKDSKNLNRIYIKEFYELMSPYMDRMMNFLKTKEWMIHNCWFQQYQKNDIHNWHTHGVCNYGNVYYLELENKNEATQFLNLNNNKIISIDIKEGDLLTFPSNFLHRSKKIKNKNYKKTIISFNSSFH